jgi:DNA-binding CsgD family transcriptional regulator/GTPase SAR1 family protein
MTLLERDAHLSELNQRFADVVNGKGRVVFLSGEAGAGKTSLIEQFADGLRPTTPVSIVSCDGLGMPGPFGPLIDIAEALGPDVVAVLNTHSTHDVIFHTVLGALRNAPVANVMIAEDAHWSDEASLNLLRFLGRRITSTQTLLVVTYREDDVDPFHPLRRVLGDLVNESAVSRMWVPPLSLESVRRLAAGSGIDPDALHQRTGGNPFYVTEIVAAGGVEVPATIRDAVLSRASRISNEGRALLDAASALGPTIEAELLEKIMDVAVDDAIEECLASGMLRASGEGVIFRHALTRDVLLSSMSPSRRRGLHRRILAALETEPLYANDLARLAHHAEESRDTNAVLRYARAAAENAALYGAHREAAAQYARALRFASAIEKDELAELLERRAYECYVSGTHEDAIAEQTRAVAIRESLNDPIKHGDSLRWLSRYNWFTGRNDESERYAHAALDVLESQPPGPELAMAYSNLSQLRMLSREADEAIRLGEKAIDLATQFENQAILVNAMTNVGTSLASRGSESGYHMVEEAARIARAHGLHDDVSRALANLACDCLDQCNLARAEEYIAEALDFTADHDLIGMELYLQMRKAQLDLERGNWTTISERASTVANNPSAVVPTRIVANTVLGQVRARLGESPWQALDEALAYATRTGELQRLGPVRIARAEALWLSGQNDLAAAEAAFAFDQALAAKLPWMAGNLAIWMFRGDRPVPSIDQIAEPFALEISGDGHAAAAIWRTRGYPLEEARALAAMGEESSLRDALAIFEQLGARPDTARAVRALRDAGVTQIPRGPRPSTRANAANLTARELDVLERITMGQSNREIADALFLSPRTVGHHVSAILAKLDITSRAAAHDRAESLGLLQSRSSATPK